MSNAAASKTAPAIPRFMLTFDAPVLTPAMVSAQDNAVTLESAMRLCREVGEPAALTNASGHHVVDVDANGAVRWL